MLDTAYGRLRIITPTLSVMDRLAAYWYHHDRQCWDQAVEIVRRQPIDWEQVREWTASERRDEADIDRLERASQDG